MVEGPRSTAEARGWTEEHAQVRPAAISRDWRSEVVYFLLPDRFSDVHEPDRPTFRVPETDPACRWDWWAISGHNRFQGGTLEGVRSRLPYLAQLGVTTLWLGPVWKQRVSGVDPDVGPVDHQANDRFPTSPGDSDDVRRPWFSPRDDYHGYAVQDFLAIDPRFGSAEDLRDLVEEAHQPRYGIRVVLDVMINHTGQNWLYQQWPLNPLQPPYLPPAGEPGYRQAVGTTYPFGAWLDAANRALPAGPVSRDDGVWPVELQRADAYSRRGFGDYGGAEDFKAHNQFRDADWFNRDLDYDDGSVLAVMLDVWRYWMVYSGCDGFRVDTFKHVPRPTAEAFVREVRAFAADRLGLEDFLVVGEVGGPDEDAARYLGPAQPGDPVPEVRVLEVGQRRVRLRQIAGGDLDAPTADQVLTPTLPGVPDGWLRDRVMTTIDDHDGLAVDPLQRLARRYGTRSVVGAAALLLFGPGIPCLYYGTEQALTGPPPSADPFLVADYGLADAGHSGDRYLREAMFGPEHPRRPGRAGMAAPPDCWDVDLPGFGPNGTSGRSAFDQTSPWFGALSRLIMLRRSHPQLWNGEIVCCGVQRQGDTGFGLRPAAPLVAWTRCSDSGQALIVLNTTRDQTLADGTVWTAPAIAADVQLTSAFPVGSRLTLQLAVSAEPDFVAPTGPVTVRRGPQTDQGVATLRPVAPSSVHVYLAG